MSDLIHLSSIVHPIFHIKKLAFKLTILSFVYLPLCIVLYCVLYLCTIRYCTAGLKKQSSRNEIDAELKKKTKDGKTCFIFGSYQ